MLSSGVELVTTLTNLVNAIIALFLFFKIRSKLWKAAFIIFMLSSLFGVVLHGFILSEQLFKGIWSVLNILMVIMFCLYSIGVWREALSGKALNYAIAFCLVESVLAIFFAANFYYFVIYCLINLLILLVVCFRMRKKKKCFVYWFFAIIFLSAASIVESVGGFTFRFIFESNQDAVYHMLILIYVCLTYLGIRENEKKDER